MARRVKAAVAAACMIAFVALCGCAGRPPAAAPGQTSPAAIPGPAGGDIKAVEVYVPRSAEEAAAQLALELTDAGARKRIDAAQQAFRVVPPLPPDAERADVEQRGEKLRAAAETCQNEAAGMLKIYEIFFRAYPHNWYARHRYAWFLAEHGMRFEAADEWEKVIRMEPRFPYAYNNLASLFNHMGRDAEAIQLYRKAIELKDDDPDFHVNLAVNYTTHRQEAMDLYGWSLPEVFWKCIGEYRRALELSPEDAEIAGDLATQFILAKFFNVTGTADEALKAYDHYLTLELSDVARAAACRDVGRIYLKEKADPRSALVWLEKALALMDDPGTRTLMDQAREALDKNVQSAP